MADTETKPELAPEQPAAPGPQLAEDETENATTATTATTAASKPSEEKSAPSISEMASNAASSATTAVKDNVFAMFGGGPKKEKKEEAEVDEPSGSSKAKAVDVSQALC